MKWRRTWPLFSIRSKMTSHETSASEPRQVVSLSYFSFFLFWTVPFIPLVLVQSSKQRTKGYQQGRWSMKALPLKLKETFRHHFMYVQFRLKTLIVKHVAAKLYLCARPAFVHAQKSSPVPHITRISQRGIFHKGLWILCEMWMEAKCRNNILK